MSEIKVIGRQNFMGVGIPVVLGGFREGKKCISDKTIAEVHRMEIKHVRELINRNANRFENGKDIIDLKVVVLNDDNLLTGQLGYSRMQISKAEHIYILSERGYAKLIKIMDTDLAWEIHDKLIDEYFELREYYKKPLSPMEQLRLHQQAILEVDEKIAAVDKDLQSFKQDMPILGVEESKIVAVVKRKGILCLGGKESFAYKDSSIRSKVYSDIYGQLKRELGLAPGCTYKAIKRSQCDLAVGIVEAYELPMVLRNEIETRNGYDDLLY